MGRRLNTNGRMMKNPARSGVFCYVGSHIKRPVVNFHP